MSEHKTVYCEYKLIVISAARAAEAGLSGEPKGRDATRPQQRHRTGGFSQVGGCRCGKRSPVTRL
jgi:hypothetical protein